MVVGVTGGIGSGKSTVTSCFKELENVVLYIADEEAKKLMNSSIIIMESIQKHFGKEAYLDGTLNNTHLAQQVFKDKSKLSLLNSIVHPEVHTHFSKFVEMHKEKLIIYENAILFEIGSDRFCDVIIAISAPEKDRIKHVMKRDQCSEKEVLDRIKNQWKDEKKILLSNYVILNNYKKSLFPQVKHIHNILTKKLRII
jgi:dephospho-CoA kinase